MVKWHTKQTRKEYTKYTKYSKTQTDYQNKHYNINQEKKKHRTTEEEMEGPTSSWGSRNRITCPTIQEHHDDDDDIKSKK